MPRRPGTAGFNINRASNRVYGGGKLLATQNVGDPGDVLGNVNVTPGNVQTFQSPPPAMFPGNSDPAGGSNDQYAMTYSDDAPAGDSDASNTQSGTFQVEPGAGPALVERALARSLSLGNLRELDRTPQSAIINRFNLATGVWTEFNIERPTILFPSEVPGTIITYCPQQVSGASSAGAPSATELLYAQASQGTCIVYLPTPGKWWLYQEQGSSLDLIVIDASDPAVVSKYLADDGTQQITASEATINGSAGAVATIVQGNLRRRSMLLYNQSTTDFCNVALGAGTAALTAIIQIPKQDFLRLDGPYCVKQGLRGRSSGVTGMTVSVWEFF